MRLRHRVACDGLLIRFHISSITHPRVKDCATQSEEAPGGCRGLLVGRRATLQWQAVVEEEVEDGEVEDAVGVALGSGKVVGEDNAGEDVVEET